MKIFITKLYYEKGEYIFEAFEGNNDYSVDEKRKAFYGYDKWGSKVYIYSMRYEIKKIWDDYIIERAFDRQLTKEELEKVKIDMINIVRTKLKEDRDNYIKHIMKRWKH